MRKHKAGPFDFSNIQIGDRLTRVYQGEIWDAEVTKITEDQIECSVIVDMHRTMRFNRKTGFSEHGKTFGFLINKPLEESHEFIEGIKFRFNIDENRLKKLIESEPDFDPSNDLLAKFLEDQEKH